MSESHATTKSEDLKRVCKELEKEKISNVELKHKLAEKEKFYKKLVEEMEKNSEGLSKSHEENVARANKF